LVAPSIDGLAGVVLMAPPAIPMQRILDEQSARMTPALEQAVRKGFASDTVIDPAQVIRHVDVPILVLQGGRDLQVLPSDLHYLADAAHAANRRITIDRLPDDDHLFLAIPPSHPNDGSEYFIPGQLDSRVPQAILAWMAQIGR
jgi:pimeloyl-ACP methyl ester carboxylesterase